MEITNVIDFSFVFDLYAKFCIVGLIGFFGRLSLQFFDRL